jgi:hypothetical protein
MASASRPAPLRVSRRDLKLRVLRTRAKETAGVERVAARLATIFFPAVLGARMETRRSALAARPAGPPRMCSTTKYHPPTTNRTWS